MIKQSTTSITKKSTNARKFSPKQSTINFLLAFAASYQACTTRDGQICDFILN